MTLEHAADEADIEEQQNRQLLEGNRQILERIERLERRILEMEKTILGRFDGPTAVEAADDASQRPVMWPDVGSRVR